MDPKDTAVADICFKEYEILQIKKHVDQVVCHSNTLLRCTDAECFTEIELSAR